MIPKGPDLHVCGGAILVGGPMDAEQRHVYCHGCHAFAFYSDVLPTGTDWEANVAAWDAGLHRSPADGATVDAVARERAAVAAREGRRLEKQDWEALRKTLTVDSPEDRDRFHASFLRFLGEV